MKEMKRVISLVMLNCLLVLTCVSPGTNRNSTTNVGESQFVLVTGGEFEPLQIVRRNEIVPNNGQIINLNNFYIGITEVTVREFREFCNRTGYQTKVEKEGGYFRWNQAASRWEPQRGASWKNPGYRQEDDMPVVLVDWYDCIEYCNWRSVIDGFEPVYTIDRNNKDSNNMDNSDIRKWIVTFDRTKNGYRLPTAAEWEYAMRGGKMAMNLTYGISDNLDDVAWTIQNAAHVMKTAAKNPNELGLYDMIGNASEWCWDWVGENLTDNNPSGPSSGRFRWTMFGMESGSLLFTPLSPAQPADQVSFRLARNAN